MALEINITNTGKVQFDSFSYNKEKGELVVFNKGRTELELRIDVPFKISKTKDDLYDASKDIDKIFVFRNSYFKEKSLIQLRYKVGDDNKTIGFVFSLRGILENDNILGEHKEVIPYALRTLVVLLNNLASLPAKVPEYVPNAEFTLLDFYDEDLIFCAISKEQVVNYTEELELSLLYQLNLYGFYLLNGEENRYFEPDLNSYQQSALVSILNAENIGTLILKSLSKKITTEPYFNTYITNLINKSQSYVSKFFIIYQCYEILIDYISKSEILTKVCGEGATDDKSGFQIREIMIKIGSESYRIDKLFSTYSTYPYQSDYHVSAEILFFFSNYKPNYDSSSIHNYGNYFYELRNTIVHNLRILFSGSVAEVQKKEADLKDLIKGVEFLTIETLVGFNI